jgi:two-component system cell cycle sensor histidine kinase/response regulator CckA
MNNPQNLLPADASQIVVLIAEDELIVRNVARISLESEGYFVLVGDNGEEALTLSRQFPGKIDALLSDVRMPRLDGLQLREAIMMERPGIKVLLMSGQVDAPTPDTPFLRKPFTPAILKQRMRQLLT